MDARTMVESNEHRTDKEPRSSKRWSPRLGIAGQIRLVVVAAFAVSVLGVWGYIAFTDVQEQGHNVRAIDAHFEEAITIVVALRDQPSHVDQIRRWLEAHYERSPFLIVDDEYEFIAQSDPPPPPERLDEVAHYDWEMALVIPFTDAQGERFYVMVMHDLPTVLSSWVDRFEIVLPAFLLFVFFVATMVIARRVLGPVRQVSTAARAIASGALHQRTNVARHDELGDLARAFDVMADRNAELLLAQKHLLAQVGHELRTPLARVRVALDIARERVPDADQTPLADVDVDLEEMARLISDILAVSRLETADVQGRLEETLRVEELQFATLTEGVVGRFSAAHVDRNISCHVMEPGDVLGDRVLLGRVLWNLLENAHNHSPPDESIELHTTFEGQHAIWVVEDAGGGIEPDLLARVFEPFFQGRVSGASTMGGFGLGLSLCKRVVDAHGGSIALENRVGGGLRARVMLPLAPATEAPP